MTLFDLEALGAEADLVGLDQGDALGGLGAFVLFCFQLEGGRGGERGGGERGGKALAKGRGGRAREVSDVETTRRHSESCLFF